MSNLSELLQAFDLIGKDDNNAITTLGAVAGTIADFAGAVPVVISAIEFVASLFGAANQDPTQVLLQQILSTVQNEYAKIQADAKARDLLTHWQALDQIIASAEANYLGLPAAVIATPPLSNDEIINQIQACLTAVITLSDESYWNVVYDDMVYFPTPNAGGKLVSEYTGGGIEGSAVFPKTVLSNGAFTCQGLKFVYSFDPGADSRGYAFNYVYILPYFLRAIMMFLAVGATLDPQFVQGYSQAIRSSCIGPLQTYHDKIHKEGIVNVVAPNFDDMFVELADSGYYFDTDWWRGWSYYDPQPYGYSQPYGAINLFSGYGFIGSYPTLARPPDARPLPSHDEYTRIFSKYLLRSLARNKQVYRGIGLSTIWQTINRLKTLVGDPPLGGPCFGDWSLREAFTVLGYPNNQFIEGLSIRDLATYLENNSPTFTFGSAPISLRQMLEGLPPDQAVSLP